MYLGCQGSVDTKAAGQAVEGENGLGLKAWLVWVAVKELNLSYYIGETLLTTIYIYPLW